MTDTHQEVFVQIEPLSAFETDTAQGNILGDDRSGAGRIVLARIDSFPGDAPALLEAGVTAFFGKVFDRAVLALELCLVECPVRGADDGEIVILLVVRGEGGDSGLKVILCSQAWVLWIPDPSKEDVPRHFGRGGPLLSP